MKPFFSIIIATHNRASYLSELLSSISQQSMTDFEVIISHTGTDDGTKEVVKTFIDKGMSINLVIAPHKGSVPQRNFGVKISIGDWILLPDDDVVWEAQYLSSIFSTIKRDSTIAGISSLITNQGFSSTGNFTKAVLLLMGINPTQDFAGRIIGPSLNFLPQKNGPIIQDIEWMPIGACAYNRNVFINEGLIPSFFTDYGFAEDVFVSAKIAAKHHIVLCRNARLFHYDLGTKGNSNVCNAIKMQVKNRLYISRVILQRNEYITRYQLLIWYLAMNSVNYLIRDRSLRHYLLSMKGLIYGLLRR